MKELSKRMHCATHVRLRYTPPSCRRHTAGIRMRGRRGNRSDADPVAHALVQAREDLSSSFRSTLLTSLARPGGPRQRVPCTTSCVALSTFLTSRSVRCSPTRKRAFVQSQQPGSPALWADLLDTRTIDRALIAPPNASRSLLDHGASSSTSSVERLGLLAFCKPSKRPAATITTVQDPYG